MCTTCTVQEIQAVLCDLRSSAGPTSEPTAGVYQQWGSSLVIFRLRGPEPGFAVGVSWFFCWRNESRLPRELLLEITEPWRWHTADVRRTNVLCVPLGASSRDQVRLLNIHPLGKSTAVAHATLTLDCDSDGTCLAVPLVCSTGTVGSFQLALSRHQIVHLLDLTADLGRPTVANYSLSTHEWKRMGALHVTSWDPSATFFASRLQNVLTRLLEKFACLDVRSVWLYSPSLCAITGRLQRENACTISRSTIGALLSCRRVVSLASSFLQRPRLT